MKYYNNSDSKRIHLFFDKFGTVLVFHTYYFADIIFIVHKTFILSVKEINIVVGKSHLQVLASVTAKI